MRNKAYEFDNRDAGEMYNYMEARIEALQRRIFELQEENEILRSEQLQFGPWQVRTRTEGCA